MTGRAGPLITCFLLLISEWSGGSSLPTIRNLSNELIGSDESYTHCEAMMSSRCLEPVCRMGTLKLVIVEWKRILCTVGDTGKGASPTRMLAYSCASSAADSRRTMWSSFLPHPANCRVAAEPYVSRGATQTLPSLYATSIQTPTCHTLSASTVRSGSGLTALSMLCRRDVCHACLATSMRESGKSMWRTTSGQLPMMLPSVLAMPPTKIGTESSSVGSCRSITLQLSTHITMLAQPISVLLQTTLLESITYVSHPVCYRKYSTAVYGITRATIYSWWLLRAAGITGPCRSNLSTPWACSQPPPFKDSPHRAGIWTSSCKAFCGDIVVIIWWRQLSLSANSSWKAPNGSMSNQQVRQMVRGQCYEMRSYLLAESYTRPPPSQCKSGKLTQEPLWSTSTTANCRFNAYLVRACFGVKVLIGKLCHSRLCRICYADGMLWRDTAKLNGWPRGSPRETSDNENANKCSNFMQVGLVPISGLCGEPPARSQAGIWGQNSAGLIDPGVADRACSNGDFTWQKWVMKVAVKQLPLPGQHTCNSMLVALLAGNSGTVLTRSGVHGCISWLPLTCAEWLRRCGMQKHARQYHAGRFQMKSGACCCTRTTTWHNLGQALGTSIPHYERRNCSKRCSSSSCTCVAQSQHLWNGTARKVLSWTSEMQNICVKASGWLTCWTPWASISTARYGDGGNRKLHGTTHLDMLDTEVARKPFCNSVVWGTGYAKLVLGMLRSTRMWRMHSTLPCITNWTRRSKKRCSNWIKLCSSNDTKQLAYTCKLPTGPSCFLLGVVLSREIASHRTCSSSSTTPWSMSGYRERRKLQPITTCARMIRSMASTSTRLCLFLQMTLQSKSFARMLQNYKRRHPSWMTNWMRCLLVAVWHRTEISKRLSLTLPAEARTSRCAKSIVARRGLKAELYRRPSTWERFARMVAPLQQLASTTWKRLKQRGQVWARSGQEQAATESRSTWSFGRWSSRQSWVAWSPLSSLSQTTRLSMRLSQRRGESSCEDEHASAKNNLTAPSSMRQFRINRFGDTLASLGCTPSYGSNASSSGNVFCDNLNFTPMSLLLCSGPSLSRQPLCCEPTVLFRVRRIRGSRSWLMTSRLSGTSQTLSTSPMQWTRSRCVCSAPTSSSIFFRLMCPYCGANSFAWKFLHRVTSTSVLSSSRWPRKTR